MQVKEFTLNSLRSSHLPKRQRSTGRRKSEWIFLMIFLAGYVIETVALEKMSDFVTSGRVLRDFGLITVLIIILLIVFIAEFHYFGRWVENYLRRY